MLPGSHERSVGRARKGSMSENGTDQPCSYPNGSIGASKQEEHTRAELAENDTVKAAYFGLD